MRTFEDADPYAGGYYDRASILALRDIIVRLASKLEKQPEQQYKDEIERLFQGHVERIFREHKESFEKLQQAKK